MGTSRGRALELEVLNAARAWRHYEPYTSTALLIRKAHRLMAAVDALEAAAPGPIDGEPASNGASTSNRAASRAFPIQGSARREIIAELHFINSRVPALYGRTSDELEQQLRKPHTTISAAVNHLVGAGWIEDSGYERDTRAGRAAIVWQLTQRALDELNG